MGFTGGVSGGQDAVTTNYTGDRGMSLLVQDESYRHGSFLELVVTINYQIFSVVGRNIVINNELSMNLCEVSQHCPDKAPSRAFYLFKVHTLLPTSAFTISA